ncbi:hypothetical protein [Methylomonas koyamae]
MPVKVTNRFKPSFSTQPAITACIVASNCGLTRSSGAQSLEAGLTLKLFK